jgi:DNA-binding transcriptional regulator YdaS (Cro superfamily)
MAWKPIEIILHGLTVTAAIATTGCHAAAHRRASARSGASGDGMVGAQHADTGAELGSTKRDHVLADVGRHDLAVLRVGMSEDVLNQVVAVLITGNVDERDARAINTALTDAVQVTAEKLRPTNLEALFNDLGGKLIHAVLSSKADDVINGAAAVGWSAVLADVLDAPIAKLAVSHDVDIGENLLNAGALGNY